MASEVIYVRDLAEMLGKSEAAIRSAIRRGSSSIPPGMFKTGTENCWRRETVDRWLRKLEADALEAAALKQAEQSPAGSA